jgi:hypothetical protein
MKAIDGSVPNAGVTLYEVPELGSDLVIDFIDASDLEQIEQGIREIQSTTDLLSLVQGIAVLKIEREGLWMQAGYHSLNEYRIAQNQRLGMPRQTLSRRRMVAEGYLDNRKSLGSFPLHGHVEKLGLLNQAVKQYGRRDAISHFKKDTFKAFSEWIKPKQITEDLTDVEIRLIAEGIEIGGEPVLLWPTDYPEPDRKWLGSVVERAYQARAGGNQALVLSVYDDGEARAVELFLKRHRAGK